METKRRPKPKTTCKMTTRAQFELLMKLMDEHKILAKGYTSYQDKDDYKVKWEDFSNQLNLIGPPERDSRGWEKVWYDLKFKVKQKINKNKNGICVTNLSTIEEKVLELFNLWEFNEENLSGSSQNLITKAELNATEYEEPEILMEDESNKSMEESLHGSMEEGLTNFDFIQLNNKSEKREDFSTSERNKSIEEQLDLIKQQLFSLGKIQKSNQSIKKDKTAKYMKKTYKIEKKKFALYQKSLKKKEEMRIKKENWKKELLKYKQEKLKIMKIQLKYKEYKDKDANSVEMQS